MGDAVWCGGVCEFGHVIFEHHIVIILKFNWYQSNPLGVLISVTTQTCPYNYSAALSDGLKSFLSRSSY